MLDTLTKKYLIIMKRQDKILFIIICTLNSNYGVSADVLPS